MNGIDSSSGYRMYAHSWGGTGTRHMICHLLDDDLPLQVSSVNVTKTTTPTNTLKFGTGYAAFSPVFHLAAGVLADKVLTVQQIYEIGIYLRALLATRGITVV